MALLRYALSLIILLQTSTMMFARGPVYASKKYNFVEIDDFPDNRIFNPFDKNYIDLIRDCINRQEEEISICEDMNYYDIAAEIMGSVVSFKYFAYNKKYKDKTKDFKRLYDFYEKRDVQLMQENENFESEESTQPTKSRTLSDSEIESLDLPYSFDRKLVFELDSLFQKLYEQNFYTIRRDSSRKSYITSYTAEYWTCIDILDKAKDLKLKTKKKYLEYILDISNKFLYLNLHYHLSGIYGKTLDIIDKTGIEKFDSVFVYKILYYYAYSLIKSDNISDVYNITRRLEKYKTTLYKTQIPDHYRLMASYNEAVCNYYDAYLYCKKIYDYINNSAFSQTPSNDPEYSTEEILYDLAKSEINIGDYNQAEIHFIQSYILSSIKNGLGNFHSLQYLFPLVQVYYKSLLNAKGDQKQCVNQFTKCIYLLDYIFYFTNKGVYDDYYYNEHNTFLSEVATLFSIIEPHTRNFILDNLKAPNLKEFIKSFDNEIPNYDARTRRLIPVDFVHILINDILNAEKEGKGIYSTEYRRVLKDCLVQYECITKDSLLSSHLEELSHLTKENLLYKIPYMKEAEQEITWQKESVFFDYINLCHRSFNLEKINGVIYDNALFRKNFLLQAKTNLYNIVAKEGTDGQKKLLDEYSLAKRELDNTPFKRNQNIDSIESLRYRVILAEEQIKKELKSYDTYLKSFEKTWKDIQDKLDENEIAIEFVETPISSDSLCYSAVSIRKDNSIPKYYQLFTVHISDKGIFSNEDKLYENIWVRLKNELSGIDKVYFSPDGYLHSCNIEILPEIFNKNDKRQYYRLSSTRLLSEDAQESTSENSAAVYGGLSYDMEVDSMIADKRKYHGLFATATIGSISKVVGSQFLQSSKKEAKDIASIMRIAGIKTTSYLGYEGTETSFKALNKRNTKYIHIATHGFYYDEGDSASYTANFPIYKHLFKNSSLYRSDYALYHSGLKFSGSNAIPKGKELPDSIDDGILFAKEIVNLNLKGLDLLTLSACKTGLGKINSEGVYGLQRAFKIAGAKTILMTLEKVDDNVSHLLFSKFYENILIHKMSKVDALRQAQRYIKEYKNANGNLLYEDPDYWTPFIILDAL